jgi:hypothetical protein
LRGGGGRKVKGINGEQITGAKIYRFSLFLLFQKEGVELGRISIDFDGYQEWLWGRQTYIIMKQAMIFSQYEV